MITQMGNPPIQKGIIDHDRDHLCASLLIPGRDGHGSGSDRRHLGSPCRCLDDGHDIATDGRPDLQEQTGLLLNFEIGAVRCQTGLQSDRQMGHQGSALGGCPGKDDLGLVFLNQKPEYLAVILNNKGRKPGMIDRIDPICSPVNQFLKLTL